MFDIIDLSHNNTVNSFHEMDTAGIHFAYFKATQGTGFKDPCYDDYCQRAETMGWYHGAYHFFTADDPDEQAKFFCDSIVWSTFGNLVPVLDVEGNFTGVAEAAYKCALAIKSICGHFPMLYASDSFWQTYLAPVFPSETLKWIARYGAMPETAYDLWQYTQSGSIAGVEGNVDLDRFYGTSDEFAAKFRVQFAAVTTLARD